MLVLELLLTLTMNVFLVVFFKGFLQVYISWLLSNLYFFLLHPSRRRIVKDLRLLNHGYLFINLAVVIFISRLFLLFLCKSISMRTLNCYFLLFNLSFCTYFICVYLRFLLRLTYNFQLLRRLLMLFILLLETMRG